MGDGQDRKKIVLLVDLDNISIPTECFERLKAKFRETYDIALAAAFCDVRSLDNHRISTLHLAGFMMVHCPSHLVSANHAKNCVDFVMTNLMSGMVRDMRVDEVMLLTSDRDFSSAVNTLRDNGIKVNLVKKEGEGAEVLKYAVDGVIEVNLSGVSSKDQRGWKSIEDAIQQIARENMSNFHKGFTREALFSLAWKEVRPHFDVTRKQMIRQVNRFISKYQKSVSLETRKYYRLSI